MLESQLALIGLERVFSINHEYYDVLFYDLREGCYYDRSKDLFIPYCELKHYGMPC